MALAFAVLGWTTAACMVISTIMLGGLIAAKTDHIRAKTTNEKRLH